MSLRDECLHPCHRTGSPPKPCAGLPRARLGLVCELVRTVVYRGCGTGALCPGSKGSGGEGGREPGWAAHECTDGSHLNFWVPLGVPGPLGLLAARSPGFWVGRSVLSLRAMTTL